MSDKLQFDRRGFDNLKLVGHQRLRKEELKVGYQKVNRGGGGKSQTTQN
jgi:hypothetical protein